MSVTLVSGIMSYLRRSWHRPLSAHLEVKLLRMEHVIDLPQRLVLPGPLADLSIFADLGLDETELGAISAGP